MGMAPAVTASARVSRRQRSPAEERSSTVIRRKMAASPTHQPAMVVRWGMSMSHTTFTQRRSSSTRLVGVT